MSRRATPTRGVTRAVSTVLKTRRGRRNLAVATAATTAAAVAGSIATDPGSLWYRLVDKPAWQPPAAAFPIVWTALYGSIAATSASAVTEMEDAGREQDARSYWGALAANLALNAGWSYLFFRRHTPWAATMGAAALAASSADLSRRAGTVSGGHRTALLPYTVWCSFATFLSGEIGRRNEP